MMMRVLSFLAVALFSYHATMMTHEAPAHEVVEADDTHSHLYCSQGDPSDAARASATALMAAAHAHHGHDMHGPADPESRDHSGHDPDMMGMSCPDCAPAKAVALTGSETVLRLEAIRLSSSVVVRQDRASPRQTTGPPVGLRAPPTTFLT